MYLADQAKRVKTFIQDCDRVSQRVDRAIEDALIEQGWEALNTGDWLKDERELYGSFEGFVATQQNGVMQDGLELAKRLGNESAWTELMKQ